MEGQILKRRRTLQKLFTAYLAVLILVSPIIPIVQQQVHGESIPVSDVKPEKDLREVSIEHVPPQTVNKNEDLQLSVQDSNAIAIDVHYLVQDEIKTIAMAENDHGNYSVVIPAVDLEQEPFEYWFLGKYENDVEKETEPYILNVADEDTSEDEETTKSKAQQTDSNQQQEPHPDETFQLQHDPITQINGNDDLKITAYAPGAETVKVIFKTAEELEAEELLLSRVGDHDYTVTIPKEKLWSIDFQYELIAADEAGKTETTDQILATVTNHAQTEHVPPLLITEITPQTAEDFEFVEIYNNTNQPIALHDYQLVYQSGTSEKAEWDMKENIEVQPQETVIVWIHNSNKQRTVADFNQFYGSNLSENNVVMVEGEAMADEGTIVIEDKSGGTIVQASYNDIDVYENKGIIYQYPSEGDGMQKVGVSTMADPSKIITGQVPQTPLEVEKIAQSKEGSKASLQNDVQENSLNETEEDYDPQTVPRLLITEITPDTVNMNGADAYEFIEIYNNSDQPINMKDYQIIYRYPTSTPEQIWNITEDKEIGPREAFIVWIKNAGNQDATLEDFEAEYGIELSENYVTTIESDGMANGSERTLIISDMFDNPISEATYNNGGTKEVVADKGIIYKFPTEGNIMEKIGVDETVTPIQVYPEQVPSIPVKIETEASVPEIGEASIKLDGALIQVEVQVASEMPVTGVQLFFRQSESLDFQSLSLTSDNGENFTVEIPVEAIWSDRIEYYFVAGNEAGQATSEVNVLELPQADIDYQQVPPLLITEVVPDTANVNGADAYEFIEIYNNTTEDIRFNDYVLRYRYPNTGAASDLLWGRPLTMRTL